MFHFKEICAVFASTTAFVFKYLHTQPITTHINIRHNELARIECHVTPVITLDVKI